MIEHTQEVAAVASHSLRWIPLLPLLGAAFNLTLGLRVQRTAGRAAVAALGSLLALTSFAVALSNCLALGRLPADARLMVDTVAPWIHVGALNVSIAFQLDPLSAVMILVVTGIGSLIHIYSYGYMDHEPALWRFFGLLNLFLFAMLVLVLGDNLLLMFVGWEGVGLCSWALIGFWHGDHVNTTAANKAFLFNRVGDFAFVCGTFLLFWTTVAAGRPTLEFRELAELAPALVGTLFWGVPVVTAITLALFVGATGKSAQIPLYVWLPDAMAGPTPVSALIHAATMVTAGIYMIGRVSFLFALAPLTSEVVAAVGAATALLAATIALTQFDIKKVLAYSTVSQLGYMCMAMGVGAYSAGVFHLMTHAFFKACLFLCAGSVIHAMHHEQDMRQMGGLRRLMPLTFATFLVSTLAISGVPPFAGFFSKDEILWRTWLYSPLLWGVGLFTAGLTSFYMFRQVFMTFSGECRADHHTREHIHESSSVMTVPLVLLAAGALGAGWIGIPAALGGSNLFEHWLDPVFEAAAHTTHAVAGGAAHQASLELAMTGASILVALAGITLAYLMYVRRSVRPESFMGIARGVPYRLSLNKYFVDEAYSATFVAGTLGLSRALAWVDAHLVDGVVNGAATVVRGTSRVSGAIDAWVVDGAVNGVAALLDRMGGGLRRVQTGSINAYLYVVLAAVTVVMFVRAW